MLAPMRTAGVLIVGNEILSGRTRDVNGPHLAARLGELGVRPAELRVIADAEDAIVGAVNELRLRHDYVFTTGGIGPTHDDITSPSIARAFGVPLVLNGEAHARLQARYGAKRLNAARLRMAHVPESAELIENPISAAPGFRIGNVFVFAGVPDIMRAMFESVRHLIDGGPPLRSRALRSLVSEGDIATGLAEVQDRHPGVEIGSYPYFTGTRLGCTVVLCGSDMEGVGAAEGDVRTLIHDLGAVPLDDEPADRDSGA